MRIQSISEYNYYRSNLQPTKKTEAYVNQQSFGSNFGMIMERVLCRDLRCRADVERSISDLYYSVVNEKGITKTPEQPILSEWLGIKGTSLIEELCKPIAKVRSEFRDIIFKSQEELVPIIKKGNDNLLYISNFGKHGFWNTVFERESATNDMRIVFLSRNGSFEIGVNKKGNLVSEQYFNSGYWKKNTYNMLMGDRISNKTGNAFDVVIMPPF